jgi:hypothetical protein
LPSEDLHGVIYLIVLGFAATGIAAMLFFCEESNAGKAFRAIRRIHYWHRAKALM